MTMTLPPGPRAPIGVSAEVKKELLDLAFQGSHHVEMMFYPEAWANAPVTESNWECSDFPPDPRDSIPKSPGVYVFVVMTNIFNFPHGNGLFYIGKATNLYERIGSYIAEIDHSIASSSRPLVWRMINTWRGHLKYFYTTTIDVKEAEKLENHMLNAFRPPFNRQYEASISKTMRAFQ